MSEKHAVQDVQNKEPLRPSSCWTGTIHQFTLLNKSYVQVLQIAERGAEKQKARENTPQQNEFQAESLIVEPTVRYRSWIMSTTVPSFCFHPKTIKLWVDSSKKVSKEWRRPFMANYHCFSLTAFRHERPLTVCLFFVSIETCFTSLTQCQMSD